MKKSRVAAAFLALFGGSIGLHKFYLRDPGAGIFYLALLFMTARFFPVTMLLGFIDAIKLFSMSEGEFDEKYNGERILGSRRRRAMEKRVSPSDKSRDFSHERKKYQMKHSPRRKRDNPFKRSAQKKYEEYDLEEAIEDYTLALEIEPDNPNIHFNMAAIYSLLEKKESAFNHLEKAVENGFKNINKINTFDDLAFIRIQPEFETFKNNGYKYQQPAGIEAPKENLLDDDLLLSQLNKLKDLREKGLLSPKEFEYEKEKLLRK